MTRLWTTDAYTTVREVEMTVPEDGQWYLHLAAADGLGQVVPDSQVAFPFKISTETPEVSSSSHPDVETSTILQEFRAKVTFPREAGQWQQVRKSWQQRHDHASLNFKNRLWILGGRDSAAMNDVWWSADGEDWALATSEAPWAARSGHTSAVFKGKMWVLGGQGGSNELLNDVWYSADGIVWQEATGEADWSGRSGHTTVVYDSKLWVMGGGGPANLSYHDDVWWSADGVSWNLATDDAGWPAREGHASVVFDNKLWVLGGFTSDAFDDYALNDAWSSADGVLWTLATEEAEWQPRTDLAAVARNGLLWIFGGNSSSDAWFSPNGVRWYEYTGDAGWASRGGHTVTQFQNRLWLIGGSRVNDDAFQTRRGTEEVWRSYDGAAWAQVTSTGFSPRRLMGTAEFQDRLWVLGGYDGGWRNDVWNTSDGIRWTQVLDNAPWPAEGRVDAVAFRDKLWVLTGTIMPLLWWTEDGVDWRAVIGVSLFDEDWALLIHDEKLWVVNPLTITPAGGSVWWTEDGEDWAQKFFSSSHYFQRATSVVFDNRMWMFGGSETRPWFDVEPYVTSSMDGLDWTLATSEPGWEARVSPQALTYAEDLWLLGGTSDTEPAVPYTDVWRSSNGVDWARFEDAGWEAVSGTEAGIVEFQDKLWVIGGEDGEGYLDEVWTYEEAQPRAHAYIYMVDDAPNTDPRGIGTVTRDHPVTVTGIAPTRVLI